MEYGRRPALRRRVWAAVLALWTIPVGVGLSSAGERYAVTGFGVGDELLYAYHGAIWALKGGLAQEGPFMRAWVISARSTLESQNESQNEVEPVAAVTSGLDAEIGWQATMPLGRVALFGGFAWRGHSVMEAGGQAVSPDPPVMLSAKLDAQLQWSQTTGMMANGAYLGGAGQFWGQLRPYGAVGEGAKCGVDVAISGGDDFLYGQLGVFSSGYEAHLPVIGRVFLGGEAGVRHDLKGEGVSPYLGINFGRFF